MRQEEVDTQNSIIDLDEGIYAVRNVWNVP